ncbi:MAG: flagellar motor switch protein FliM [Planctomycetes bacterium]|nr:flagellar motor switch protein FliM [Planctomycetota bacterium]
MKDLLSNEEIDTLLELFKAESKTLDAPTEAELSTLVGAAAEASGPLVTPVDLLKPNRLNREQLRSFERIFESTAKALSASMGDRLRIEMRVDCVAVEQLRFAGWNQLLSGPVAIYVLSLPPLDLPVLFTLTAPMLYGAVDRVLGGSGKVQKVPKDFSAAEWTVADAFVGPCLDRVCASLSEVVKTSWSIESRFTNVGMAQVLSTQEAVLSAHFQCSSELMLGDVRLALPYAALERHLPALSTGPTVRARQEPGQMRDRLTRVLAPVELELAVKLGDAEVPLRQLLALKEGDVVPLRARLGDPLVAPVQGRPKFLGQIGRTGNRLAFQVGAVVEG